ncbi:hypothetical protein GWO43_15040 [candidate division KSB1 bacterium]|nr:hypothetical protein [candidate division KSB1 bacterium]NIR73382.1 hypothetical protein [candidate division KSB1 bacterium]NIS25257.1 hypothetical protein [candidate division KSB1 bacterium]NIT72160.1 hypothetical protein [candidate division KSB1 bacterium]NIU25966.1 hypothetical protein [candidate division KSB1 bacterium]
MDRFLEFENEVNMEDLKTALAENNPGILLLRLSKLTGTVKVRAEDTLSNREIKRAFSPYRVKRIYNNFPLKV